MRNTALALIVLLLAACSNGAGDKPMPNTVAPPAATPAKASPAPEAGPAKPGDAKQDVKAPVDETAAAKGQTVNVFKAPPNGTGLVVGDVPVPDGVHVRGGAVDANGNTAEWNVHTNDPAGKLYCPDNTKDHCAEEPDGSITVHTAAAPAGQGGLGR